MTTQLAEMDTARTIACVLSDLRRVREQLRAAIHYAECIANNPAIDHDFLRATVGESVLHEMTIHRLEQDAVATFLTLEAAAKRVKP